MRNEIKDYYTKLATIKAKFPQYDDVGAILNQSYYDPLIESFEKFRGAFGVLAGT
jgi:hypothetical protein